MTDREKFEEWINGWWPQTKGNLYFNNGNYTNNFVNYAWEGWQAALASQQPADDGWIEWAGGECPVAPWEYVSVKHRSDKCVSQNAMASYFDWSNYPSKFDTDIIAYRVVKP